ncbi:uncharacterized protein LOC121923434 [Sceloporus undulatus]|uniref:uncharacterized protein LOC121923434 n=1 Tax=Sceloporus undulatus TaxID=8520 RepID=UPI001C4AC4F8|nr:uncharacterized protein LOC121923434 [Sceloporus undulatus]
MADSQSTQKWDALLALPGEEKAQGQLHESHRNPDVFGKEAELMRTQGQSSMVEECRTKSKSSEELVFYKGLEQIFSGDPTSQANRGATEPKTSSPVSSKSTSTSDFLDSCPELYPSDLEEDLEVEDSFMLSFCPLGQDTQDTDFAFPANIINTARLGQRNGSSSSQPVAHADKVNEIYASRQIASFTPVERLALIRKRREKSTCEKMAKEMMECSKRNIDRMLECRHEHFLEEMKWKKMFLEETRSNFRELIGVLKDFSSTYKETCAKLDSKELRVVRRVRKKIPEKVQNTE